MSKQPSIIADAQARALIEAIQAHRETECARLLADAWQEAGRIIREARSHARKRFHEAAQDFRREGARRIEQARAARDTELRQQQQKDLAQIVERACPRLSDALNERWRNPQARAQWIGAALTMAQARLRPGAWRIVCPEGGGEELRSELLSRIDDAGLRDVSLEASGEIAAGIQIHADGAVIDATPQALLRQGSRVQAALIAEIEYLARERRDGRPQTAEAGIA